MTDDARTREELLAALERERRVRAFLSEAARLLASSLDQDKTLEHVARLVVPGLADGCVLDVVAANGELRRVACVDADPAKADVMKRLGALPPPPREAPVYRVLALDHGQLVPAWSEDELQANSRNAEHAALLRALGPKSGIIVPVRARARAVGILWMYTSGSGRVYGADDVEVAEELASRVGMALDNARLFEEVEAAVRLRDDFLAIASHELRTPLTPLKLQLARLRRELAGSPNEPRAQVAERQVDRLIALVAQLLDVSRITGGRLVLQRENVDLADLVREAAADATTELRATGGELRARLAKGATGDWDRLRIEQVVTNVLSNAVKYGAGADVDVTVEASDASATLLVRDRGIGVARDDWDRIFGRFERAASARHYGGFGLGLWIARQIVEAHGGRIDLEDTQGPGSTFRVELPRESVRAAPHVET